MADDGNQTRQSSLEKVLKGLLRPLVKAMISQGISAQTLYGHVKKSYVDVADELLGESATDSRISIITGVHRRDVKAMRGEDGDEHVAVKKRVSTLTTVIGRWLASPGLTDDDGQPRPLPRTGDAPSFESLVQSVSRDIRPRSLLDEMTRQKIAFIEDDLVHLSVDALVGPADQAQRIHFFSQNVGDHLNAAVENLVREDPRFMERAVYYNHLAASSVEQIEQEARALAQDMLITINKKANALQEEDAKSDEATRRFRLGVFFYDEDEAGDDEEPKTP